MTLNSQQRLPPPAFEDPQNIRDNDVRNERPSHLVLTYSRTSLYEYLGPQQSALFLRNESPIDDLLPAHFPQKLVVPEINPQLLKKVEQPRPREPPDAASRLYRFTCRVLACTVQHSLIS